MQSLIKLEIQSVTVICHEVSIYYLFKEINLATLNQIIKEALPADVRA